MELSVRIFNMDCLTMLKGMPDNSVELIVTDPPYGIDGMGAHWNHDNLKARTCNRSSQTSSVSGLPASMPFNPQQGKELQAFLEPIFRECLRVLKPGGYLISFSQGRLYPRMACAAENAGFEVRDMCIWKHQGGQGKAASQTHRIKKMRISEKEKTALIESIGGRKTPQLLPKFEPFVVAMKPKEGTFVDNWQRYRVGLIDVRNGDAQQSTIFECPKPNERAYVDHMTIKPIALLERLIEVFSSKGQTVLDPFMGTGTTGKAAINTGRKFIGSEIEKHSFKLAQRRLEN